MARPSRYRPEYVDQAAKLCKLGLTDKEIAKFFEVAESTLHKWKHDYPEFSESLKAGKTLADAEVASKLFHRATGYEHPEDDIRVVNGAIVVTPTIKHYPPDTTAAIFWLKNRNPAKWRDKPAEEDGDGPPPQRVEVTVRDARKPDADAERTAIPIP